VPFRGLYIGASPKGEDARGARPILQVNRALEMHGKRLRGVPTIAILRGGRWV
jgi:hypothetical protein